MSNIVNDETGLKEYWKISSTKPCVTSRTALLGSKNIILDYVKAQNLEFIFCRGAEKISLIRLSGVPAYDFTILLHSFLSVFNYFSFSKELSIIYNY